MALASHPGLKLDNAPPVSDGLVSRRDVSPGTSLKGSLRGVMERVVRCPQAIAIPGLTSMDKPGLSDLTDGFLV